MASTKRSTELDWLRIAAFGRARSKRLLLPLLLGVAVVVPPQA